MMICWNIYIFNGTKREMGKLKTQTHMMYNKRLRELIKSDIHSRQNIYELYMFNPLRHIYIMVIMR